MQSVMLIGRLCNDPEVKTVGDKQVTNFRLAVDRNYSDKTDFFTCQAWSDKYLSQYGKKGNFVIVTGEFQTNKVEDITYFNFVVDRSKVISEKKKESNEISNATSMSGFNFADFEDASSFFGNKN